MFWDTFSHISYWGFTSFAVAVGFASIAAMYFSLPGIYFIAGDIALYCLLTGLIPGWHKYYQSPLWWIVFVVLVFVIISELVETALNLGGAAAGGVKKWGLFWVIVSSMAGAALGSLIPIFGVGTILGGMVGAFLGGFIFTWIKKGKLDKEAWLGGFGAFAGRTGSLILKTLIALLMMILFAIIIISGLPFLKG